MAGDRHLRRFKASMLHLLPFVSDCLPVEEDRKAPAAGQRVIGRGRQTWLTIAVECFDHLPSRSAGSHRRRVNVLEEGALLAFAAGCARARLAPGCRHAVKEVELDSRLDGT